MIIGDNLQMQKLFNHFTDHYKIMVDDYEQLQVIKTAYPKFDNYLKILKMGPNGTWPIRQLLTTMEAHFVFQ